MNLECRDALIPSMQEEEVRRLLLLSDGTDSEATGADITPGDRARTPPDARTDSRTLRERLPSVRDSSRTRPWTTSGPSWGKDGDEDDSSEEEAPVQRHRSGPPVPPQARTRSPLRPLLPHSQGRPRPSERLASGGNARLGGPGASHQLQTNQPPQQRQPRTLCPCRCPTQLLVSLPPGATVKLWRPLRPLRHPSHLTS